MATVWLSIWIDRQRERSVEAVLAADIDERNRRITDDIMHVGSSLEYVATLLDIEPDLDQAGFAKFVTAVITLEPAFIGLGWNPRVRGADRETFESDARRRLHRSDYQIIEPDGSGRPAGVRPEYVAVLLLEPLEQNRAALGLDILGEPIRRAAVDRARDLREMSATAPLRLVQVPDDPRGYLVAFPRYDQKMRIDTIEERREAFLGVVVGIFRVGDLIERALGRARTADYEIEVIDETSPGPVVLHRHLGDPEHPLPLDAASSGESILQWAGRNWRFRYIATEEHLASLRGRRFPWTGLAGLAISILLAGTTAVVSERSRRRVAEEVLRTDEERFRLTLGAISDGWWDWDLSTGEITLSRSCLAALGLASGDEAHGRDLIDRLLHPGDAKARHAAIADHLAGRTGEHALELRMRHANGEYRWFLERSSVVTRDESGRPIRMVGAIADITRRKIAERDRSEFEERMRETQRLESLGLIAGGVAHDFNNWLTTIRNNIEIARGSTPRGEVEQALAEIDSATTRAADLTSQMLDYAGKGPPRSEKIDLGRIVAEMRDLLRSVVPKGVRIEHERTLEPATIVGDSVQIGQVVMNLITNASDALGGAGVVQIRTSVIEVPEPRPTESQSGRSLPVGRYSVLEVSDRGCGMPAEVRTRIFEPFFSTKETGRGLGLAGVQGIIRRHDGSIEVDSSPGRGTTITIFLPHGGAITEDDNGTGSTTHKREPAGAPRIRRVLIIDDEVGVRDSLAKIMRREGHTVSAAATGLDGIELLRTTPDSIQVAVIDMTMPGLNGVATFQELRAIQPDLEGVIISGYTEAEIGTLPEGIIGFLQKPFRTEELLALVGGERAR